MGRGAASPAGPETRDGHKPACAARLLRPQLCWSLIRPSLLPRLLQALGGVRHQLCSLYRQFFLNPLAAPGLPQGLLDRAQRLLQ